MRPSRERPRARSKISFSFALIAAAVTASVLCANSAVATPHDQALSPLTSSHHPTPHAVTPVVRSLAVAALPVGRRVEIAPMVGAATAAPGLTLVAQEQRAVTHAFSMVGVTWAHDTAPRGLVVNLRVRTHGQWGAWTKLLPDPDGPAVSKGSTERDGTVPLWVGPDASGIQVDVYSADGAAPHAIGVDIIDPGTSSFDTAAVGVAPSSPLAAATSTTSTTSTPTASTSPSTTTPTTTSTPTTSTTTTAIKSKNGTFPSIPHIITRKQWGADPSLANACWAPRIARTFKMVFVHHTAGSNNYTEAESAAIVRGIYAYHTQSRGWCDIGYNFLVDKYGNIFEGRRGGIRQAVRGAHAGNYNVATTGISLMGNFDTGYPTLKMKRSLVSLISWRMGTAYHGAYGKAFVYNAWFKRISGHRDAMATSCPGNHVYSWLPRLRQLVSARLGNYRSPIEKTWLAAGGPSSSFGTVHVGERGSGPGHVTTFNGGRGYSYRNQPAFLFRRGPILSRYLAVGQMQSQLGYPSSSIWVYKKVHGQGAAFRGGRIYWSPTTGGRVLLGGPVLTRYVQVFAARGKLGFPVSPVYQTKSGNRARFQHGSISYNSSTGKTTVSYT
ncbi:MAG: N-acetylmuramoyl-L-alanine amidase [Nocardioidaceae bacterium]